MVGEGIPLSLARLHILTKSPDQLAEALFYTMAKLISFGVVVLMQDV